MQVEQAARKRRGAWYTPADLIDVVVSGVLDGVERTLRPGATVRIVDPSCGDGRFLVAIARTLHDRRPDVSVELTGCDIDADTVAEAARRHPEMHLVHADARLHDWDDGRFDVVVGNPPFLSQMSSATTRGGASHLGGGPYADAATEFLALALRLARADGGRIGLVLPQSILGARDAGAVREDALRCADLTWSWWEPRQRHFDADVNVCALGFMRPATGVTRASAFSEVVTTRLGIPTLDRSELDVNGTIADRAELNANFRDEYYALVPAVGDDVTGPPLITSGLIDPGTCAWGERPVTFAKRTFAAPRVDLGRLSGRFPAWAARKLVPKVLVANQTKIIEAVADPEGAWLPGVPVTTVTPFDPEQVWPVAAVLTSPIATLLAWQRAAGTGLTTTAIRLRPAVVGSVPWPAGDLEPAVAALRAGDVQTCGVRVCGAYGLDVETTRRFVTWWMGLAPNGHRGRGAPDGAR